MSKALLSVPGNIVRFSTYDNVEGSRTFEGEVLTVFSGKSHTNPALAKSTHINIYPNLPDAVKEITPNDFLQYNYFTLLKDDGSKVDIGIPWVVESSIEEVVARDAVITLEDFSDEDGQRVRKILTQNGYKVRSVNY